ncbi:MAG: ABC transporter ATP-binding protein [Litorilinea sp.]|nr:MAG: ABC transporter ATP-binding protein [Litorilinea sp.]
MAYLQLIDLQVAYDRNVPVLDGFHLSVERGELVSLLGPSGCGKTTTLRTVAGFIEPSRGQVLVDGQDYTRLPPNRRDIGLVFQSYALFPHLSVFQNVAFGLRMRGLRGPEVERRVREALALVDLAGYENRRPAQLSGGQRQRVAVARAIVIEPKLLLMDEPLSNLDAKLRTSMRTELRRLQQRLGITMLYVTHDQVEALSLSDRVVVMNRGQIEQIGTPEEIFHQPATPFVADFMGFDNCFPATVAEVQGETITLQADGHRLAVTRRRSTAAVRPGEPVSVYFRPEGGYLCTEPAANSIPVRILLSTFRGSSVEYVVESGLGEFMVHMDEEQPRFEAGPAHLQLAPRNLVVMPRADDLLQPSSGAEGTRQELTGKEANKKAANKNAVTKEVLP